MGGPCKATRLQNVFVMTSASGREEKIKLADLRGQARKEKCRKEGRRSEEEEEQSCRRGVSR